MKKYNLSNIMKAAWTIRRSENATMSKALKKAWANAKKEESTMKGTEKQIAWAAEIRANVIKSLEFVKANSLANVQVEAQKRIDLLNEESVHAGDIIDIFKDIHFGKGDMQDAQAVMFAYNNRVYMPNTDGARRLLCK